MSDLSDSYLLLIRHAALNFIV